MRGAGAVSPRGAEPGRSEALSPAEGPLCRRRDPRVLRISGSRGIGTVSGARRPPRSLLAASRLLEEHPAAGFQRRPGARRTCGDGTPDPPGARPSVRVACPAGAASQSGSPSQGNAAVGGAVGRGHGAALASGSAGRPVCSPRAGGHQAWWLRRLPAERRGGPETATWGQLYARRFLDSGLWCERTQISRPGRKKVSF